MNLFQLCKKMASNLKMESGWSITVYLCLPSADIDWVCKYAWHFASLVSNLWRKKQLFILCWLVDFITLRTSVVFSSVITCYIGLCSVVLGVLNRGRRIISEAMRPRCLLVPKVWMFVLEASAEGGSCFPLFLCQCHIHVTFCCCTAPVLGKRGGQLSRVSDPPSTVGDPARELRLSGLVSSAFTSKWALL